jgi:uncharacterized protein YkwD
VIGFLPHRIVVVAVALLLAIPGAVAAPAPDRAAASAMRDAVNFVREYHGLVPLALDIDLSRAAQGHAEELARRGELSHRGLDGSRLGNHLREVDYPYSVAAENLAAGPPEADGAVILWLNSPGHRRNLLLEGVTAIGVGYARAPARDDRFRHYWVLVLAAGR